MSALHAERDEALETLRERYRIHEEALALVPAFESEAPDFQEVASREFVARQRSLLMAALARFLELDTQVREALPQPSHSTRGA